MSVETAGRRDTANPIHQFTPVLAAQALSDAHTYLFEERERLLALQAENDALRLQGDTAAAGQTRSGGGTYPDLTSRRSPVSSVLPPAPCCRGGGPSPH